MDSALQTGPASAEVEVGGDIKDLLEQEAWETAEGRGPRPEYCGLIRVEVQVHYPKIVDQVLKELLSPSHYTLGEALSLCETAPEGPTREKSQ